MSQNPNTQENAPNTGGLLPAPVSDVASSKEEKNPLMDRQFVVRVVEGRGINIHIHVKPEKRVLHIWRADEYKLLAQLIDYVKENGKKKVIPTYYSPQAKMYYNNAWEITLTAGQIVNLLDITRRNRKAQTLDKIMNFITAINSGSEQK